MRFRHEFCALLLIAGVSGCAIFRPQSADMLKETLNEGRADLVSPPAISVPRKHVLRIEPSVIIQRIDEDRIRLQVWEKLCECGLMSPDARRKLNENGFRVGVSGAAMPWALNGLLEKHRSHNTPQRASADGDSSGPIFFSASGGTPSTVAIPENSESVVIVRDASGAEIPSDVDLPGLKQVAASDNVRCVLRLTTLECTSGSALVRILPELRFGRRAARFSFSNGAEGLPIRQRVLPLYDQQFEIRLHTGDSVVMGYSASDKWTPGKFFLQSDSLTHPEERLIVLRLAEIETIEGQRSLQVTYSKW